MVKHSAGPWRISEVPGNDKQSTLSRISIRDDSGHWVVATLFKGIKGDEQVDANARLISAAPELLGACKRVLFECCARFVNPESCGIALHGDIRAAIEKAEGTP